MAEMLRSVRGETNPVVVAAPASTAILLGDLVVRNAGNVAQPVSAITGASLAAAQQNCHNTFLGVSQDKRTTSQNTAGSITIATTGRAMLDTASALTQPVGTLIGVSATNNAGTWTCTQTVVNVATANLAIGRLAKSATSAATVEVQIFGLTQGGPQEVE